MTVGCEYDGYPTVIVTTHCLSSGALVLAAGVHMIGFAVLRWARRPFTD